MVFLFPKQKPLPLTGGGFYVSLVAPSHTAWGLKEACILRLIAFAAAVLCSATAWGDDSSPQPLSSPGGEGGVFATYVLRTQSDRCDPEATAPPFQILKRGIRCAVAWKNGKTEWFDAVYAVRPVINEGPRLATTHVPLYVARKGREWYFGRGTDKGPPFREVWEYRDVLDVRYWTAHARGSFHLLSAGAPGWTRDSIEGPVRLKNGLPDFTLAPKVASLDQRPSN